MFFPDTTARDMVSNVTIMKFICRTIWMNMYGRLPTKMLTNNSGVFKIFDEEFRGDIRMLTGYLKEFLIDKEFSILSVEGYKYTKELVVVFTFS